VHASGRLGIKLFQMHVQLEPLLEEAVAVAERQPVAAPAPMPAPTLADVGTADAAFALEAASPIVPLLESEPCARCGGRNVRRSRIKGMYERFRKLHTPARPFRCDDCDWRGWLLPLDHAMAIDEIAEADLHSLDAALAPLSSESGRGSNAP
jgi:hypothetical protein